MAFGILQSPNSSSTVTCHLKPERSSHRSQHHISGPQENTILVFRVPNDTAPHYRGRCGIESRRDLRGRLLSSGQRDRSGKGLYEVRHWNCSMTRLNRNEEDSSGPAHSRAGILDSQRSGERRAAACTPGRPACEQTERRSTRSRWGGRNYNQEAGQSWPELRLLLLPNTPRKHTTIQGARSISSQNPVQRDQDL